MKGFLYFTAAWCQPCQTLGPTMDAIAATGVPVKKVNVDYDTQFVQEYNVRNIQQQHHSHSHLVKRNHRFVFVL